MAALLGRLIAAQRSGRPPRPSRSAAWPGSSALLGRSEPAAPHGRPAVPGLVDPLTSRELEVLEMLAAGKSNQAIAERARRHARYRQEARQPILGKLGAANRTEAVSRARELSLIP